MGVPVLTNSVSPGTFATKAHYTSQAPWINLLANPTQPEQPNPTLANYNPVVSRYAFWVEDETAKVDVSVVGNAGGAGGSFSRSYGSTNDVTTLTNRVQFLDLGALPLRNDQPLDNSSASQTVNQNIINFYKSLPFFLPDYNSLNKAMNANLTEQTKFHTTTFSRSLDLAGTGRRRINLNALVSNSTAAADIAGNIRDISYVMTGTSTNLIFLPNTAGANEIFGTQTSRTDSLTTFGERFWPPNVANPANIDKTSAYLTKLAANIRDYIDTDSQPTYITGGSSGASRVVVTTPMNPSSPPTWGAAAIGKEAIAIPQEHAWHGLLESMTITGSGASAVATATFSINHYFEFYNPYTKAYTAPAGSYIHIYSMPSWSAGTSFPAFTPGDTDIDIGGVTFPAGQIVIITTQSDSAADPAKLISSGATIERRSLINGSKTRWTNLKSNEPISGSVGFQFQPRSSSVSDGLTEFCIVTPTGLLDYNIGLSVSVSPVSVPFNYNDPSNNANKPYRYLYGSSMRGNDAPSRSGDPRSLSEMLGYQAFSSSANPDQNRWYGNLSGGSTQSVPGTSTLGQPNTNFVNPASWPDPLSSIVTTAAGAYGVIRDGPMTSIGELGNIYDPHRKLTTVGTSVQSILLARGGGRTLKVGQQDDLCDTTRFGAGSATLLPWFNSAWRLCDIFAAESTGRYTPASDFRNFVAPPVQAGKVNLNGVLRDEGVALRAALRNLVFLSNPDSDGQISSKILSDTEINSIITSIKSYLTTTGPFMERGELSQISYFNSSSTSKLAGTAFNSLNDRGREEVFRRMVELVTTRSASYSVYAVGETVKSVKKGASYQYVTLSRQRKHCVVTFDPLFNGSTPTSTTHPNQKVSSYGVSRLYVP
jgi:hypothetical protein